MLGQNRAFNYTISKIYYERFLEYGSNAKSSFWVSKKTQELRFEVEDENGNIKEILIKFN